MHTGSTTFSLGGSAAGSPLPLVDLDCSSNPNYPAAAKGYRIRVTIAGKIGGASGKVVEAGDVVEAVADNAGGTEASVGTSWIVIQANIAGMTAAGLSMITAADAAAQAALLTTLMPKAGGSFTGLTGAGFRDTSAAFDVTMTFTSSTALDAGRSITWDVKNSSHQLKFTAASIVTFPSGTNTLLGSAVANTIATNGAASTPALIGSGTIFTGGTATTTKPYWLIEPSGTTSTGWSTGGTGLGLNMPSGFAGRAFDVQFNGSSKLYFDGSDLYFGAEFNLYTPSAAARFHVANNIAEIFFAGVVNWQVSNGGVMGVRTSMALPSTGSLDFSSTTSFSGSKDVGFARTSAGVGRISDGSTGRGTLDAAGYQVGGVAGTSGTITAASTVTVVNGIVTVIA